MYMRSLALGFANITGYSVLSGLAAGMDPVCGQAFGAGYAPLSSPLCSTAPSRCSWLLCPSPCSCPPPPCVVLLLRRSPLPRATCAAGPAPQSSSCSSPSPSSAPCTSSSPPPPPGTLSVASLSIRGLDNLDAAVRADNGRNRMVGIDYRGGGSVTVSYAGVQLAAGPWPAFRQPLWNVTVFEAAMKGLGVRLTEEQARQLATEWAAGSVRFGKVLWTSTDGQA